MSKLNVSIVTSSLSPIASESISQFLSRTVPMLGTLINIASINTEKNMNDDKNIVPDLYDGTVSTDLVDNDENRMRKDVLGDLPNWANMTLEEMLPKVAYHKRTGKNGVSTLKPLQKENLFSGMNEVIPVRNANDGSEMGRNQWSGDDPETTVVKAMARDEGYLINWGFDISSISAIVDRMVQATDSSNTHPFGDAEDLIEYMVQKRKEKYEGSINGLKKWLMSTFGRIDAQKVWNTIRTQIEVEVSINKKEDDSFDFEKACNSSFWLTRTGQNIDNRWVNFDSPLAYIVEELGRKFGKGTRLEKSGYKIVAKGINAKFWGTLTGALDSKPLSGAMEGTIKRWVVSKIREEALKVWAEDNHVDRQVADMGAKTPWSEYKPEEADYVWWSRE